MYAIQLYHNPQCSKSRQTLQLLEERGMDAEVIEYLKTPPDAQTLTKILDMLGLEPRQLMRDQEPQYKALGLDDTSLNRDALIRAMVQTPKLMQRPIVVHRGKAAVGRPPERVLEIL